MESFRDSVNSGNSYQGKNIELLNDINLNGSADNQWIPIGNSSKVFAGTFDGKGNVIENIYIDTTNPYQGFFGYIEGGAIKNLGINSGTLKVGNRSGGIVGYNSGSTIEKCYNNVNIYVNQGKHIGGLVGIMNNSAYMTKCYNAGNIEGIITEQNGAICGLVGNMDNKIIIEYCYNKGNIKATSEQQNVRAAGIANGYNSIIKSCYNIGEVSMEMTSNETWPVAAGVIAQVQSIKMYNCYNIGRTTVTTTNASFRNGGLAGYFKEDSTMENCYWLSTVSPLGVADYPETVTEDAYEAIKVDTESEMKQIATLLGEDYVSDYTEEANQLNGGYPILKWQTENNQ